ncbi:40s ribosomal protein [Musa troglodytarum]|uniref:40s ribosomal protein n=1 Tax=Musa troglodytarum TaxID=320322 RepID=A0A9E7JGP9_9LILI|nr:40s ribosomal protein [Musa troglodytarum]
MTSPVEARRRDTEREVPIVVKPTTHLLYEKGCVLVERVWKLEWVGEEKIEKAEGRILIGSDENSDLLEELVAARDGGDDNIAAQNAAGDNKGQKQQRGDDGVGQWPMERKLRWR